LPRLFEARRERGAALLEHQQPVLDVAVRLLLGALEALLLKLIDLRLEREERLFGGVLQRGVLHGAGRQRRGVAKGAPEQGLPERRLQERPVIEDDDRDQLLDLLEPFERSLHDPEAPAPPGELAQPGRRVAGQLDDGGREPRGFARVGHRGGDQRVAQVQGDVLLRRTDGRGDAVAQLSGECG